MNTVTISTSNPELVMLYVNNVYVGKCKKGDETLVAEIWLNSQPAK